MFPTSWIKKNGIRLNRNAAQRLDILLEVFFRETIKHGKPIIITNAMISWINNCLKYLPKTKRMIRENRIRIISAREDYQHKSSNMILWKQYAFKDVVDIFLSEENTHHIISIGDAEYEYNALVELCDVENHAFQILKNIKLLSNPSFDVLIDQLEVINRNADYIFKEEEHMDMYFRRL